MLTALCIVSIACFVLVWLALALTIAFSKTIKELSEAERMRDAWQSETVYWQNLHGVLEQEHLSLRGRALVRDAKGRVARLQ